MPATQVLPAPRLDPCSIHVALHWLATLVLTLPTLTTPAASRLSSPWSKR
jgi:hypothetical protein